MVSRSENSFIEIRSRSTNVILRLLISCLIFLEFELQVGLPIIFNSRIRIDFGIIIPFQKPGKQGFCTQRYDTAARSFSATETASVPEKTIRNVHFRISVPNFPNFFQLFQIFYLENPEFRIFQLNNLEFQISDSFFWNSELSNWKS